MWCVCVDAGLFLCPLRNSLWSMLSKFVFHTNTCSSAPTDAKNSPVGEKATPNAAALCPWRVK